MAEGWLLQETQFYLTEYLRTINPLGPQMWNAEQNEKLEGEVLQGKGKEITLTEQARDQICTFMIYNTECMQRWTDKYQVEREQRFPSRKRIRRGDQWPEKCPLEWLQHALDDEVDEGSSVTVEEREISFGCSWKVILNKT